MFMKRKNIKFELQGKARKYLSYIFKEDHDLDKEYNVLKKLTQNLRRKLILESHGKILNKIPFFLINFSQETIEELAFCLKELKYSPEEFIYKVNLIKIFLLISILPQKSKKLDSCSLYIVESGTVQRVMSDNNNNSEKNFGLKHGELLGLHSFLTDEPRKESCFCKDYVTVLELRKSDFLSVLKEKEYVLLQFF